MTTPDRQLLQRLLAWGTASAGDPAGADTELAALLRDARASVNAPADPIDDQPNEALGFLVPPGLVQALDTIRHNAGVVAAHAAALHDVFATPPQPEVPLEAAGDGVVGE